MAMGGAAPPPWYRWHWFDFLKSCRGWSFDQRAIYRDLLDVQWQEGSIPKSPNEARAMIGCSVAQWDSAWPLIEKKFPVNGTGRKNPRMEFERRRASNSAEAAAGFGKRGAEARWGSHSKKNQAHSIGGVSDPYRVQMADKKILDLRLKTKDLAPVSLTTHVAEATLTAPAGLNLGAWREWIEHRKLIKKPIRDHQAPKAMQAMVKLGDERVQQAAVDHSIASGWQGLFEPTAKTGAGKKIYTAPKSVDELEAEEASRNAKH